MKDPDSVDFKHVTVRRNKKNHRAYVSFVALWKMADGSQVLIGCPTLKKLDVAWTSITHLLLDQSRVVEVLVVKRLKKEAK